LQACRLWSALPDIDLSAIPEDQRDAIAALLRENSNLTDEKSSLQQVVKRLEHQVAELNHVVHGKKPEKLDADDRQLAFEGEPMDRSPRLRHRSERPQATVREILASETAAAEVEKRRDCQTSSDDAPQQGGELRGHRAVADLGIPGSNAADTHTADEAQVKITRLLGRGMIVKRQTIQSYFNLKCLFASGMLLPGSGSPGQQAGRKECIH
jgi:hypothetical protein